MNARKPDVVTVAVSRVDGGLTVMRVVVNEYVPGPDGQRVLNRHYEPTPEYIDSLIAKYVEGGCWVGGQLPVSWRFVPNDFVDETTDRTFRNAWKDDGQRKPGTDMPKAREIHRQHLRRLRQPLLDALDIEDIQAAEEGLLSSIPNANLAKRREIAAKKQALRDVTADPAIEAAQTPDELKAVIPAALSG